MNNIQLNIVANAQFQQVYAEVAKLKEAMASLQKISVGGPFAPGIATDIKAAQAAFDSAITSTRAFTTQHVAMTDSVTRFGKQLQAGKLSLNQYYKIWRDSAKGVSKELDLLAQQQARLNRSIAIADPLRPGYAKLITDLNGVVTAQEKAIFYQKALNTALHDGSMKLINFGKNTQWMGRQITVGLTMPVSMLGAALGAAFFQVDKELVRLQKVYGSGILQPTQEQLTRIRVEVESLSKELANSLGTAAKETAAMAADLAATGLEGSRLLGATKEAIRLATLGELDHQQAMQATVSLQNVYKLSTEGLSEAINFLNAVENQTSTSLQDLVDAIPRVGPVVQQLGGSFKDTAAMMVAMKEAGVPAAQGANAIKSTLASLINPTKRAQEAFRAYKIDLASIGAKTGGNPIEMFKMLANELKNLDRLSQQQLIEKLFGKYQLARVQALLDNINNSASQTATVFDLMGASTADLASLSDRELKTLSESASGRFKRMVEGLKAELIPLGEAFLNSFTAIGNAINKIVSAVERIGKALGPVGSLLGKLFGGAAAGIVITGPILMLTGLFANLIGNLLKGANYMRMFRQGMEEATPTQNRFVAGLQNMRNFYENLDAGMIAARNQMELMPEAITTNAKAFEILSASIKTLTLQFQALAEAQALSMGVPLVGKAGAAGKAGARFEQLKFPGFSKGGRVYFSDGDFVGGPNVNADVVPAMLTPGEFVLRRDVAQSDPAGVRALNEGKAEIVPIKRNFGGPVPGVQYLQGAGSVLAIREAIANLERLMPGSKAAAALREKHGLAAPALLQRAVQAKQKSLSADEIRRIMPEFGGTKRYYTAKGTSGVNIADITDEEILSNPLFAEFVKNGKVTRQSVNAKMRLGQVPGQLLLESIRAARLKGLPTGSTDNFLTALRSNGIITESEFQTAVRRVNNSYESFLMGDGRTVGDLNNPYWSISDDALRQSLFGNRSEVDNLWQQFSRKLGQVTGSDAATAGSSGASTTAFTIRLQTSSGQEVVIAPLQGSRGSLFAHASTPQPFLDELISKNLVIEGRAKGGDVRSGTPYIVGEKGPELFVPGKSGTIIPHLQEGGDPLDKGGSRMMRGMGVSMAVPIAMSMLPNKINGADVSGLKGLLGNSALAYGALTMLGGRLGAMAGPAAIAVAAIQGLSMAFANASKSTKEATERLQSALISNIDSLNHYRVATGKTKLSTESITFVQLKQEKSNKKLKESAEQATTAVMQLAGSFTSTADKAFIAALKTSSEAERQALLATRYFADLQSSADPEYARTRSIAAQQTAGISFGTIPKANTLADVIAQGRILGTEEGRRAGGSWGNVTKGLLFGGQYNIAGKEFNRSLFDPLGINAKSAELAQSLPFVGGLASKVYGFTQGKGSTYYQQSQMGNIASAYTPKLTQANFDRVTDPKYAKEFRAQYNALNDLQKAALNSDTAFRTWNDALRQNYPQLAQIDEGLRKAGVSMQNLITVTQMASANFFSSIQQMQQAAKLLGSKAGEATIMADFEAFQNGVKEDVDAAQAKVDAARKAADAAHARAAAAASGDTTTSEDKSNLKKYKAEIDAIQEQIDARDKLYQAQMRNIEAQTKEMNLEADVIRARGSGDLLKMAAAKQALLVERTKNKMESAKAQLDDADKARIAELQKKIAAIEAKQSGPAKTISTKAEDDALAAALEELRKAQMGQGAKGSAAKAKLTEDLDKLTPPDLGGFWNTLREGFDKVWKWIKENIGKPLVVAIEWVWEKIRPVWDWIWERFGKPIKVAFEWVWEKIKEAWDWVWEHFGKPIKVALEWGWEKVKEGASWLWAEFTKLAGSAWEKVKELGSSAWEGIKSASANMWEGIKDGIKYMKEWMLELQDIIVNSQAFKLFKDVFESVWGWVKDIAGYVGDIVKALAEGGWTVIKDTFSFLKDLAVIIFDKVSGVFDVAKDKAWEGFKTVWKGIHDFVKPIWTWMKDVFGWIGGAAWNTVKNIWERIEGAIDKIHTNLNTVVTKLLNNPAWSGLQTIWNGIKSAVDSLVGGMGRVVDRIISVIRTVSGAPKVLFDWILDKLRGFSMGGPVGRYDNGGLIRGPGGPTSDIIPAMLSNGEYVVNASAVGKYGIDFLNAINNKSYSVPRTGLDVYATKSLSDSIANSTQIGGNTINVYPPVGADANEVAKLVIDRLDVLSAKQTTARKIGGR